MNKLDSIAYVCGSRDFHAMDSYRSARSSIKQENIYLITDLIKGEGFKKLINEEDKIENLIIIDKLLFKTQSKAAHIWRNLIKLFLFPFQLYRLKIISKRLGNCIYYAHSMYYILLCSMANLDYIAIPQGSEILIRPFKSKLYRYFSKYALISAKLIIIDSKKMQYTIKKLYKIDSLIVQNGIDTKTILSKSKDYKYENKSLVSFRGIEELYRINEIFIARKNSKKYKYIPIKLAYPFKSEDYYMQVNNLLTNSDEDLGRLDRNQLYRLFSCNLLSISIPKSDSSPKSVYESIFCGCIVATTQEEYLEDLPYCMRERVIIINLKDPLWLEKAIEAAIILRKKKFTPSEYSIQNYDQYKSFVLIHNRAKKILGYSNY
tara:strand:+ start:2891 stop:4018 length:1128 start_codon:yes stop_codon:yes gene_type:complete